MERTVVRHPVESRAAWVGKQPGERRHGGDGVSRSGGGRAGSSGPVEAGAGVVGRGAILRRMTAPARKPAPAATLEGLSSPSPRTSGARGAGRGRLVEGRRDRRARAAQFRMSAHMGPFDQPAGRALAGRVVVHDRGRRLLRRRQHLPPGCGGLAAGARARAPAGDPDPGAPRLGLRDPLSNKRNDLIEKKRVYHRHQVPHYWIVDPERETLPGLPLGVGRLRRGPRRGARGGGPRGAVRGGSRSRLGVLFGDDEDESEP